MVCSGGCTRAAAAAPTVSLPCIASVPRAACAAHKPTARGSLSGLLTNPTLPPAAAAAPQCVPFSRMIESLKNSSGECSASSTGVTITTERQDAGIRFTYPTCEAAALRVLVCAVLRSLPPCRRPCRPPPPFPICPPLPPLLAPSLLQTRAAWASWSSHPPARAAAGAGSTRFRGRCGWRWR